MSIEQEFEDQEILSIASTPLRVSALQEAVRLTSGDRNKAYGEPVQNHEHIAAVFNAITGHKISARDVALFHVATKLARLAKNKTHRDSYVDAMAYLGIALECAFAGRDDPGLPLG